MIRKEKRIDLPKLRDTDYYYLSMHEDRAIDYQQIYVAGNETISLLQRIVARDGSKVYTDIEEIFKRPAGATKWKYPYHRIYVGNNENYMVFKEQSDPRIHVIASCSPYAYFNSEKFRCEPCDNNTRSWGV